jgi:hypothetical protein
VKPVDVPATVEAIQMNFVDLIHMSNTADTIGKAVAADVAAAAVAVPMPSAVTVSTLTFQSVQNPVKTVQFIKWP